MRSDFKNKGSIFSDRLSFLRKQESISFYRKQNWIPVFTGMTKLGNKGRQGWILFNSKGLSVLFLVIAMFLMVTIGYVFSYLIPTKQKSVIFSIQSTQAYFLAQSGVEYAIRMATVQNWLTATDLNANLNAAANRQRNLGAGRFTISYTPDILTSIGEVPIGTEKRRIVVSNFTSFLITYFGSASNPPDNGPNTSNPTEVTPPGNMRAGDLVLMIGASRDTSASIAMSNLGGQSWTSEDQVNHPTANCRIRLFWCTFNGTWTANPSVSFGNNNPHIVVMHVFRPPSTNMVWQRDVLQASGNYSAPSSPFTVTIPGITTVTDGALVFATWASSDNNTWGSLTAGWTTPGLAQYRTTSGADLSQSHAFRVMAPPGATGSVSKNQATLGGDPGVYLIIAFRAVVI
ncbi:MAG: hypothetical protein N3G78_11650 [Desulfobacterota bacterium]|nr:hypothetical protein [Thermodesulfobacteriota bacterium]